MEQIKKIAVMDEYNDINELSLSDQELLSKAKAALKNAYAPYSKFLVGCALRLQNGEIITGNNQENAAYPSGLCAERVAIFYAGSKFPNVPITAMAITARSENFEVNQPVSSCGACLQSMNEYEMRDEIPMRIILQGETGKIRIAEGLHNFMPFRFDLKP
jgi:cytidine deaminase